MNLSAIITSLLNPLVGGRVWFKATPDSLPRDADDRIRDFLIWSNVGGQDAEYVGQTMGSHSNARLQINAYSPSIIAAETLLVAVRDKLLTSEYTVGVYGSPVGTYDAARKLSGVYQQFSIWFPQ